MPRSHAALWRDPALPHVESRRACHSRACYKAHSPPTFSIGVVDAGHSHFTGAGNGQQRLTPGTLVLVPARRVHACNPEPGQAWSYQMLHVAAHWLAQLHMESGLEG
ncbi:AraC family ligand binding domain-containing protein, partial [Jeotgalicoccus huakuii]|nr:AraC family ligand binding domain-containing protein [Jeotgalicoccus huakuii]